jgi:hypothetical protein
MEIDKKRLTALLAVKRDIRNALEISSQVLPKMTNPELNYYKDIITLGNRISRTLRAPPGYQPGMVLVAGIPPAPQPESIRKGKLGNVLLQIREEKSDDTNIPEEILLREPSPPSLTKQAVHVPIKEVAEPPQSPKLTESNKREAEAPPAAVEQPKRRREIAIDFGFDSDSDD